MHGVLFFALGHVRLGETGDKGNPTHAFGMFGNLPDNHNFLRHSATGRGLSGDSGLPVLGWLCRAGDSVFGPLDAIGLDKATIDFRNILFSKEGENMNFQSELHHFYIFGTSGRSGQCADFT